MTNSTQTLREQIQLAAVALARADGADDRIDERYAHSGISEAQLQQLRSRLLDAARQQLSTLRAAVLQNGNGASALPGLPGSAANIGRDANEALAALWRNLAEFETIRGDREASIAAHRKTIAFSPGDVAANAQLADLLESRHDLAPAQAHAETALRGDPGNVVASLALTRVFLRKRKFVEAERAATNAAQAPRAAVDERAMAWALLGEARDRRGDAAGAFKAFAKGNELMRRQYGDMNWRGHPAHPANVRQLTQWVERTSAPVRPDAFETPAPAFLIGFPRSGTTLIEQVLAAHSGVVCLGETDHLFEAMSTVLRDGDLFERAAALTPAEIETVRAAYQRIVERDRPGAAGKLIVDKHPLHITLLPLINRIWPDAKIILSQRDPRDVVLSCFQQCFGVNVATAQFWELQSTADYFDAVMGLMLACRAKLALDLHEVKYRNVVADLEGQGRAMAAHLGLAFEPAMLLFNETARKREINSASARQVIDPIYNRSVERWRRYAREMAPVLPLLDKWARRLAYEG